MLDRESLHAITVRQNGPDRAVGCMAVLGGNRLARSGLISGKCLLSSALICFWLFSRIFLLNSEAIKQAYSSLARVAQAHPKRY